MATTLGTRRSGKRPIQETDFNGKPLLQAALPENDGIEAKNALPHPGDRVTSKNHGSGLVLSVGEMAMWRKDARSIEVRFDSGTKWFVSRADLEVA